MQCDVNCAKSAIKRIIKKKVVKTTLKSETQDVLFNRVGLYSLLALERVKTGQGIKWVFRAFLGT